MNPVSGTVHRGDFMEIGKNVPGSEETTDVIEGWSFCDIEGQAGKIEVVVPRKRDQGLNQSVMMSANESRGYPMLCNQGQINMRRRKEELVWVPFAIEVLPINCICCACHDRTELLELFNDSVHGGTVHDRIVKDQNPQAMKLFARQELNCVL
jgi:hypothetical protein